MATANATLSRGGTSVDIPLIEDPNTLVMARDIGKPTQKIRDVGREDPVIMDSLNANDNWTIAGILHGSNAYSDAKTLAETIIKPRLSSALTLDLSDLPNKSSYSVVPTLESSLRLTYVPGIRKLVGVQLSLATVDSVANTSSDQNSQSYSSPDSGSGIKLARSSNSVTLTNNLEVTRTVGRPGITLNPNPATLPIAIDQNRPATDRFEISGDLTSSSAESNATTLEEDVLRQQLGSGDLTLHFLDNLFSLDAYPVTPDGSGAGRTTFQSGQIGQVGVPSLKLRVIEET